MTQDSTSARTVYRIAELSAGRPVRFALRPGKPEMERIAEQLGLSGLRKVSFTGTLASQGKHDWRLDATLGATVIQPCVVSLEPVTTRLDTPVERVFVADMPGTPDGEEIEMPEDDSAEPLPESIDLTAVMIEALTLALPDYPRRDEAALERTEFTPPGADPIREEETKPFAALASLRDKLDGKG